MESRQLHFRIVGPQAQGGCGFITLAIVSVPFAYFVVSAMAGWKAGGLAGLMLGTLIGLCAGLAAGVAVVATVVLVLRLMVLSKTGARPERFDSGLEGFAQRVEAENALSHSRRHYAWSLLTLVAIWAIMATPIVALSSRSEEHGRWSAWLTGAMLPPAVLLLVTLVAGRWLRRVLSSGLNSMSRPDANDIVIHQEPMADGRWQLPTPTDEGDRG
ncbi:hypothetical protein [Singulisphaera sp. PoT]|uniref:hypothetical protein n=1 Tax=Singulisphaera sp. PoT TaxID=3411797 RepID=UPI003BF4E43B